ncbi:MAG: PIN domain-containing protein [Acidilobaceae archaeon]
MEAHRLGGRRVVVLLVDSNIFIYIAEGLIPLSSFAKTLEASYIILVPDRVIEELANLSSTGSHYESKVAKKALEIATSISRVETTSASRADDAIVELAVKIKSEGKPVVVATADRELRARLREIGVPTMYYRKSRGELELEWEPL